jgi:hypothetical protein
MTTLPPYATTRGSRRLFAKSAGSTFDKLRTNVSAPAGGAASRFSGSFPNAAQAGILRPTTELCLSPTVSL